MGRFFDVDGPFMSGLTKMADIFILNLLLVFCSLPIFTFGASYTAMYYVTLKMVKDEECYTFKSFFKSFKQNFKQATIIWLIMLVVGAVLFIDIRFMNGETAKYFGLSDSVKSVMSAILMALAIIYAFTFVYIFPVLSKFDNSVKNTIKNALLMSIRHFPMTIAIVVVTIIPFVLMLMSPRFIILIFIGIGLSAYVNSFLFMKIFKNYMPEEDITSDENFEVAMDSKKENE